MKPNAHLEYNADISSSSESKFYYAADTSKSYVISNVNESNHNIRLNLGIDLMKDNGWSFKSNYERNQNETGYSDTLYIGATYISANDSEYALALDGEKTFWYPSLKLFRQNEKKSWKEVIERLSLEVNKKFTKDLEY